MAKTQPETHGPATQPATHPSGKPPPKLVGVLIALLCLLWGSTWFVIRDGLRDLPPFTSAGMRFTLAAVAMAVIAALFARRETGARPMARVWVMLGVVNFGVSYGIVYWAETILPSGIVAVLWGVFPLMMAACGHFFLPGEQLRGVQWTGFVAGFFGILFLFATDLQNFGPEGVPAALILLVSPLISAFGTTVVKRDGAGTNSMLMNRNAMFIGAGLLLLAGVLWERDAVISLTPRAIFSVTYLALCGTVATFGIYFWLLRYADAHRLGLIAYVTPVIALTLGWALGEEPVTWNTILGTALVLSGVVAVLRGKRRGSRATARSA